MPYFYPPPQPTQATPHVPIGTQGDSPPRRTNHGLYALRGTWSEPSWPAQYGPRIAPQTLVYGDQPPRRTNAQTFALRALWPEPSWPAQSEPDSAAYNVAIIIQPPASQLARIYNLRAQWPEVSWPAQYSAKIAPLTLVYGDQPPRFNSPQPVWPQPTWSAQSAPPNAAWNVPAVVSTLTPPPAPQWQIWQAWQSPPQAQQRATTLVQPSTGDSPPPHSIYLQMAVRNQWAEVTWPAQGPVPNAAWNFVPAQVDNPPPLPQVPWQIWASWNVPPQPQQLTQLQVVDNPPPPQPVAISVDGHRVPDSPRELEQLLFRSFDTQEFANPEVGSRHIKPVESTPRMDVTDVFNAPSNATSPTAQRRYDAEIMAILWMLM